MSYVRKTKDCYRIEGLYYGNWETEVYCEDYTDAKYQLTTYQENCPGTLFRIMKYRERI